MRYVFILIVGGILILSGCERSQVNYEKPNPTNKWVLHYTGNEMAWWTVGGLVMIILGNKDLDPTDDELSW